MPSHPPKPTSPSFQPGMEQSEGGRLSILLSRAYKVRSLKRERLLGTLPVKSLDERSKKTLADSSARAKRLSGMGPEKSFAAKSPVRMAGCSEKDGRKPEKLLPPTLMATSFLFALKEGKEPLRSLEEHEKVLSS